MNGGAGLTSARRRLCYTECGALRTDAPYRDTANLKL
jgi:hypothetical protein